MKPDWKDAPEWENYLAMDGDNKWHWYENKPKLNKLKMLWDNIDNNFASARPNFVCWYNTLEQRPEKWNTE